MRSLCLLFSRSLLPSQRCPQLDGDPAGAVHGAWSHNPTPPGQWVSGSLSLQEAAAIIAQRPDNPREFFKQQERVASGSSEAVSPGSHRTGEGLGGLRAPGGHREARGAAEQVSAGATGAPTAQWVTAGSRGTRAVMWGSCVPSVDTGGVVGHEEGKGLSCSAVPPSLPPHHTWPLQPGQLGRDWMLGGSSAREVILLPAGCCLLTCHGTVLAAGVAAWLVWLRW